MRRREFIALVAVAGAWPLATRAQQGQLPVVGYLSATSAATATYFVGFRDGLKDAGYVEGQNLAIEYRWAEGQYDRLPILAAELVRRPVAVVFAAGIPPVLAAAIHMHELRRLTAAADCTPVLRPHDRARGTSVTAVESAGKAMISITARNAARSAG